MARQLTIKNNKTGQTYTTGGNAPKTTPRTLTVKNNKTGATYTTGTKQQSQNDAEQQRLLGYDVSSAETRRQEAQKERDAAYTRMNSIGSFGFGNTTTINDPQAGRKAARKQSLIGSARADYDRLGTEIDTLTRDINAATKVQTRSRYDALSSNDDFEQYSGYNPKNRDGLYQYINGVGRDRMEANPIDGAAVSYDPYKKYQNMSDADRKIYNYLTYTQGARKAGEFLEFLDDDLRQAKYEQDRQAYRDYGYEHPVIGSVLSVPTNLIGGVIGTADFIGRQIAGVEQDPYSNAQLLSSAAQDIRSGASEDMGSLGKFLYNTAMSAADSLVAGKVLPGKIAPAALLSSTAFSSGAQDLRARGANDQQILMGALAAATFEWMFESISIGNFKSMQEVPVTGVMDFIGNLTKSSGVNFTEEALTELSNIVWDTATMGDISQFKIAEQQYIDAGYSPEKAHDKVIGDMALRVLEAGASGMLMGFGFGGIGSVQSAVQNQTAQVTKQGKQVAKDGGYDALIQQALNLPVESNAHQIAQGLVDGDTKQTNWSVGVLSQAVQREIAQQDIAKAASKYGQHGREMFEAAAEMHGLSASELESVYRTPYEMGLRNEEADRSQMTPVQQQAYLAGRMDALETSDNTDQTSAVKNWTGYGEAGTKAFSDILETSGLDIAEARMAFQSPYEMGMTNTPVDEARMSDLQRAAYRAGQSDRQQMMQRAGETYVWDEGLDTNSIPAEVGLSQQEINDAKYLFRVLGAKGGFGKTGGNASITDKGVVTIAADFGISDEKLKALGNMSHLAKVNKLAKDRGRSFISVLAHELAVHRTMQLAPTEFRAFMDAMYRYKGKDVPAAFGTKAMQKQTQYGRQGVSLTVDKAIEEYVADLIVGKNGLYKTDAEFMAAVRSAIEGAETAEEAAKIEKGARTWLDSIKAFLRKLGERIKVLKGAQKEQAQQVYNEVNHLKELFEAALKAATDRVTALREAGVANQGEESGDQYSLKDSGITMTEEEYLDLHDVQYNLKAEESHKAALKKHYSAAESVVSRDALMARYEKVLEIWKRIGGELDSKFLEEWNNKTDRVFTIFKAQQGYKYNVELSAMCKKGVPLFEAIDIIVKKEVMRELKLDVLGKAEKEILYDILKQHNFEIPCAICYVEQARQREGVIIDAFLNGSTEDGKSKLGWNTVLDDIEAEMRANGVEYKFQNVSRSIATEKYTPADIAMDENTLAAFHAAVQKLANNEIRRYNKEEGKSRKLLKEVTPEGVKACFGGTLPSNLKIFKTLLTEPSSRFRIDKDLLYSSMTTTNLASLHNGLYGLFNAQGGVSGYKTKQSTTVYWGELLGKRWRPDIVRRDGGIRQQSNSDFQMYTFLDKAQMYIDHTAKGYYVQEYTKVLAELKLFGLSRAKMNASLIPKVVEYKNADGSVDVERTMLTAGLDEYGNPIYDDIEGINHAEAFMLLEDPNYSRSLCGICIGYSDKHIEKLLDEPRVQMIIGFHDKTNDPDKRYRGARYAKNYNGLNEAVADNGAGKTVHIGFNPYLQKAEKRFTRNESTKRFEGTTTFGGKQYVANDIPRLAADMYLADCAKKGYRPAYNDFTGHPNYYKLLSDIGLYDSLGQYAPHEKVAFKMPDKIPYLDQNGNKRFMPTEEYIKTELQKEMAVRDSISEALSDTSENGIIPQFKAAVEAMRGGEQYSLKVETDMQQEIDQIREEGQRAGKSEAEIERDVRNAVVPQYQELLKQYGAIKPGENPTREVQVPKRTSDNQKVSQTVRTILEAKATPETAIPTIEEMVAKGEFSFDVYTDKRAVADAKRTIHDKTYAVALADWLDRVKHHNVSKENTALGWVLYNNAANSGDLSTAMTILTNMVEHQRDAAQVLQASRILNKLSPEAQLYAAVRAADNLQSEIERKQKRGTKAKARKQAQDTFDAVDEARTEAKDAAKNAHKAIRGVRNDGTVSVRSNQTGEPFVFEYAQKVGEAVAKGLEAGQNRVVKERTFLQQITAELKRFAVEKMPKKEGKKALTAVDLLRSYVQNQEFFADAWQYAQEELREKYAGDPAFDEFLNTGIGVDANANPSNAIFMRALVKAAADSGEGKAVLRRQSALGFTGMANTIADNLIQQTGAKGEMADTIRDAAHAYVLSTLKEEGKADADIVVSSIRAAMSDIGLSLSDVVKSGTKESATQAIINTLVGRYGFGLVTATNTAEVVSEQFEKMCREAAQKKLESMFKARDRKVRSIEERMQELANLGAFDVGSEFNEAATKRLFGVEGVRVNEMLAQEFLRAQTKMERDEILKKIYLDIGSQMPSTFADKWHAWRYIAMLGNTRTHIRNTIGNAVFAPTVLAKDILATAIEAGVYRITGGNLSRSKAFVGKQDRALIEAAMSDYDTVAEIISNGGKYKDDVDTNRYIDEGRQIFGRVDDARTKAGRVVSKTAGRFVEWARKKNSELLEKEDVLFSKPHYAYAMAQYCKANGITAQMLNSTDPAVMAKLDKARVYAVNEAEKATFRDTNMVSEAVSQFGRYHGENPALKVGSALVDSILPFRKTPANILVRGVEYSPIGLLRSIKNALFDVRSGKISGAEAIDRMSAGIVGTVGSTLLGALLAHLGIVQGGGSGDEDEERFLKLQGHQNYSLNLPGGISVTLDWLAPMSIPFFLGVNLVESKMHTKNESVTFSDIVDLVLRTGEPLLEMTCLQGINDAVDVIRYSEGNAAVYLPAALAANFLAQGIPAVGGQIERSLEGNRMTTFVAKNGFLPGDVQRYLGKASAKMPGDYQQIPYIDAWGRTQSNGNIAVRFANNMLNPAYTSTVHTSSMEQELMRLYNATGEAGVFPDTADASFRYKNQNVYLTAEQYVKYAKDKGQSAERMVTAMTKSSAYRQLNDADKAEAVSLVYDYTNAVAKMKLKPLKDLDYAPSGWIKTAHEAITKSKIAPEKYIAAYVAQSSVRSLKNKMTGKTIPDSESLLKMEAIYSMKGLTDEDRSILFEAFDVGKSVRHYSKSLVSQKVKTIRTLAD